MNKVICEEAKTCDFTICPHYVEHSPLELFAHFEEVKRCFCTQYKALCHKGYTVKCNPSQLQA